MRGRREQESAGQGSGEGQAGGVPGKVTLTGAIQRRARGDADRAPTPTATGDAASLPAPTQAKMEDAFGFDFSSVRVHEGPEAGAVGAVAYTQGTDVHFAPGQYDPASSRGQELLGHELAHVVQQSEGRVQPTTQFKGVAGNDDDGLEREADDWGTRAARGERIGRAGGASTPAGAALQRKVIQRAPVDTHYGRFIDSDYRVDGDTVVMHLTFAPGAEVDATKIGMTQSVRTEAAGAAQVVDAQTANRQVASGPGAGYEIDRIPERNNPVYGSPSVGAGQGLADTARTNAPAGVVPSPDNATYELGHRFTDASGPHEKSAWMHDAPSMEPAQNTAVTFETTALALEGAQQGTYYGSVKWGLRRDAAGVLAKDSFAVVSQGTPSQNFLAAAEAWNSSTTGGSLVARNQPTQVLRRSGGALTPAFTIDRDTLVTSSAVVGQAGITYHRVTIGAGAHSGESGYILAADLRDRSDGPATVDLPVPDVHALSTAQELNADVPGPWRNTERLPAGTRVVRTGQHPGLPPAGKVHVRVVDGPNTGAEGYVDDTALRDERP